MKTLRALSLLVAVVSLLVLPALAVTELVPPINLPYGQFGWSIAVSGQTLVVSGSWIAGHEESGKTLYVYQSGTNGAWNLVAELTASNGDHLQNVAIAGNTIVAGAPGNDDQSLGCAYVFVAGENGWQTSTETAILVPSDYPSASFGLSVAINGKTILVGSTTAGTSSQGQAYIYVEPQSGWQSGTETAILTASNGKANDDFGASVSISGVVAVVGAPVANNYNGVAYVFQESVGGWQNMTETAELSISQPIAGEHFGSSTAIQPGTIVIGAPGEMYSKGGRALVYVKSGTWQSTSTPTAILTSTLSSPQGFGTSVAINLTEIAVGDPFSTHYNRAYQGSAFIFDKPAGGWISATPTKEIKLSGDLIGQSIALNWNKLFIGAPCTGGEGEICQGAVFVGSENW